MAKSKGVYVRVWEIQAKAGLEEEFEKVFGPEGEWVALFRKSKAFLNTELFRDLEKDGRYFIVDHFASQSAFQAFLKENRDEYDALDRSCDRLCASEKRLGSFLGVEAASPATLDPALGFSPTVVPSRIASDRYRSLHAEADRCRLAQLKKHL